MNGPYQKGGYMALSRLHPKKTGINGKIRQKGDLFSQISGRF